MAVRIDEIIKILDKRVPEKASEDWDNVGYLFGSNNITVERVLTSLDVTDEVIEEAISKNCQLIISHHPFIFKGLKSINFRTTSGKKVIKLAENSIGVYSIHTNADVIDEGLNDLIMKVSGIKEYEILETSDYGGTGRIGVLNETLGEFLQKLKNRLNPTCIRFSGDLNDRISKIAVINGSGSDYFEVALRSGADTVLTGDTKYHDVLDYMEKGLKVIDIGHFDSEWTIFKEFVQRIFESDEVLNKVQLLHSEKSKDVFKLFDI